MKIQRKKSVWAVAAMMAVFIIGALSSPARAQQEEVIDTKTAGEAFLYRGDIVALKVYSLTRIAVSKPGIVEIVNADVDQILLAGKAVGETQFFIWDELGKRTVVVRVLDQDLTMIQKRIEKLIGLAEIKGVKLEQNSFEGKIVALGKVNRDQKKEFDKVVSEFSGYLINMVQEQQDLIQIDAKVTELGTTLTEAMGVNWVTNSFTINEDAAPGYSGGHGLTDIFRLGDFARTNAIEAAIQAQEVLGLTNTLSRPSLVVADGETASINVGGEIPISSETVTDGGSTENIDYETYGVSLSATPTIKDNDKIEVVLQVTIREPVGTPSGNATRFTTTTANTKVLVDSGQTIILAGMIKKSDNHTITKVPFLGDIPILGMLFRHKSGDGNIDQEVVIILTPHIRRQSNKLMVEEKEEQVPAKTAEEDLADIEAWEADVLADAQSEDKSVPVEEENMFEMDEDQADSVVPMEEEKPTNMDTVLDNIEDGEFYSDQQEEDATMVVSDYARAVQRKIATKASFPYEAQEQGWKGTVKLSLKIFSDGSLGDVNIKESSGRDVFDQDALRTAEIVAPFSPFPIDMDMEEIVVTIPVVYEQESNI